MNVLLQEKIDIKEDTLLYLDKELLSLLLKDQSSKKNIIWAVDDYIKYGENYKSNDFMTIDSVIGDNNNVIKPRIKKTKLEQTYRIKKKAEVFTPSWICNKQNNLVDNAWFDSTNIFNKENENGWITNSNKIGFINKKGKTWQDYIKSTRLEITCGEAPYLTSRYDTVTGEYIEPFDRVGLLDRKLRVICENAKEEQLWIKWAIIAVQNIYGYDWQGDNVLLARENILYTVLEHFEYQFNKALPTKHIKEIAHIISWNIWQMDGLKYVIPNSCNGQKETQLTLFNTTKKQICTGCKDNLPMKHSGIYSKIMDWNSNQEIRFVDLIYGAKGFNGK